VQRLGGLDVPLSVDTVKPDVMRQVLAAGAAMINDITALRSDGALGAVAESGAAVCLMHMQGEPRTMQVAPHYEDVVSEVAGFLHARAQAAVDAGIARDRIVLDPGFGFGKTARHNLDLLRALPRLTGDGFPWLAGLSRKSLLGKITGRGAGARVHASLAAALLAAQRGAAILRVHDVAATRDALLVLQAIENPEIHS
jgi:dihydropteroate synthase